MMIQLHHIAVTKALALVLALLTPSAAETATDGAFSVLSMNVAGLPQILQSNDVPGDKTENARSIGRLFSQSGFDVIHVQEVCLVLDTTSFPLGWCPEAIPSDWRNTTIPLGNSRYSTNTDDVGRTSTTMLPFTALIRTLSGRRRRAASRLGPG